MKEEQCDASDPDRRSGGSTDLTSLTVRELVLALARTEEDLRELRDPRRVSVQDTNLVERRIETVAAQGRIVRELRYRRRPTWRQPRHARAAG